ncbi:uncharacterized protein LOC116305772 [Actinia tenebrosa]|uniref:Uncharacterized protein LOC116305772 n=1 Tax=Actinia tenebrosa TaxID=6105 RepID=A0A6P8J095_ACTTE|nr:uncharacterized protein LOC116305772 [Actinia tenebrosa]
MWKFKMASGKKQSEADLKARESALNDLVLNFGFPKEQADKVLTECHNNVDHARERLCKMYGKSPASGPSCVPPNEPPPPYSECASSPISNPPLYISQEKEALLKNVEERFPVDTEERCSSCFDPIKPDPEEGFSGKMIWQGTKAYHSECYMKSKGPKCEHCCFALIAHPSKGLSGEWGIYDNKKYHEECYRQFAGPRCSSCCDVIAPNSEEGFTGRWIEDHNKIYHEECFAKKNFVEARAKYS